MWSLRNSILRVQPPEQDSQHLQTCWQNPTLLDRQKNKSPINLILWEQLSKAYSVYIPVDIMQHCWTAHSGLKASQNGQNPQKSIFRKIYENFFLTHQNYLGDPTLSGTNDIRAKLTQPRPYMAPYTYWKKTKMAHFWYKTKKLLIWPHLTAV